MNHQIDRDNPERRMAMRIEGGPERGGEEAEAGLVEELLSRYRDYDGYEVLEVVLDDPEAEGVLESKANLLMLVNLTLGTAKDFADIYDAMPDEEKVRKFPTRYIWELAALWAAAGRKPWDPTQQA